MVSDHHRSITYSPQHSQEPFRLLKAGQDGTVARPTTRTPHQTRIRLVETRNQLSCHGDNWPADYTVLVIPCKLSLAESDIITVRENFTVRHVLPGLPAVAQWIRRCSTLSRPVVFFAVRQMFEAGAAGTNWALRGFVLPHELCGTCKRLRVFRKTLEQYSKYSSFSITLEICVFHCKNLRACRLQFVYTQDCGIPVQRMQPKVRLWNLLDTMLPQSILMRRFKGYHICS